MDKFSETIIEKELFLNVIHPSSESNQVLLALHGWTGYETTMSIFSERIGREYWVFQPRGFFAATPEGFGWVNYQAGKINTIQDFKKSAEKLHAVIKPLISHFCDPLDGKINIVGFSQGAALALVYSLIFPDEIKKVAILAGFLPSNTETLPISTSISNVNYFISHGIEDTVISIDNARKTLEFLNKNGATISYCEGKGGHRVSAECFKNLNEFFNESM